MRTTPTALLVEERLGRSLREFVVSARCVTGVTDRQKSWRQIAEELTALTGVPLTKESVRWWFEEDRETHARITAGSAPAP